MHIYRALLPLAAAVVASTAAAVPVEATEVVSGETTHALEARSPTRCTLTKDALWWEYDIWAENFYDIEAYCRGLWDNLKSWSNCTPGLPYCGGIESTHILNWKFRTPHHCNPGQIGSVWYSATQNKYGSISC